MNTEDKLNTLIDLVDDSIALFIGHITELNQVEQLLATGQELQEKLKHLKQLR